MTDVRVTEYLPIGTKVTRSWTAPGEWDRSNEGCDCFWHNRRFSFVARGPVAADEDVIALNRQVSRVDWPNGDKIWEMELRLESTLLKVRRSIAIAGDGTTIGPVFAAYAEVGGARAQPLVPMRDYEQVVRERGGGRADPTLLFELPNRAGRLVVWPEAWWWRPVDGIDPLSPYLTFDQAVEAAREHFPKVMARVGEIREVPGGD